MIKPVILKKPWLTWTMTYWHRGDDGFPMSWRFCKKKKRKEPGSNWSDWKYTKSPCRFSQFTWAGKLHKSSRLTSSVTPQWKWNECIPNKWCVLEDVFPVKYQPFLVSECFVLKCLYIPSQTTFDPMIFRPFPFGVGYGLLPWGNKFLGGGNQPIYSSNSISSLFNLFVIFR